MVTKLSFNKIAIIKIIIITTIIIVIIIPTCSSGKTTATPMSC